MHWEWIVPVIALALWILSSLIRTAEDKSGRRPLTRGEGRTPERPSSEVEKFLAEVNRMRQRQASPVQEEPKFASEPQPIAVPVEETKPADFERPQRPAVEVPRPIKQKPRQPARPRRTQVAKPLVAKVAVPRPGAEILDVIPVQPVAPPVPKAPVSRQTTPSPAVAQLWTLLRTPGTLQTAILLQEVLGPPKCRRAPGAKI
jgi:hypothetical protein